MNRILTLLCIALGTTFGFYQPSLKVRFDFTCLGIGTIAFVELPRNKTTAVASQWVQVTRPNGPEELSILELWCPKDDYTVCVLLDDTSYIAGLQIAFNKKFVSNAEYDWKVQGFTDWTTIQNGTTNNYFTTQQYYVSNKTLSRDAAARIGARNSSLLLQDGSLWVSGINGELYEISTNASEITGDNSIFTKQQCIPRMGYHYYNITSSSECIDDQLFPWFPLIYNDQLIGIGFNVFAEYNTNIGSRNWFEYSGETALKYTVPNGPECLYEVAGRVGQVSLHTYFIENPFEVVCMV